ncbi:hypothetical protein [Streptomyces sp. 4F14]|uniref:hypothetical protein n=1 Tax=Streptomyces sp. 4F14 TaxID=3394380 RepID=UPI003A8A70F4
MKKPVVDLARENSRDEDATRGVMRAYDAWALKLSVLMDTLNARAVKMDLERQDLQAVLAVISGRICVLVSPGLSERDMEVSIRSLLARYLHRPASFLELRRQPGSERAVAEEPGYASDLKLGEPPDVPADVLALYEDGNWAPKDGWRSDDEVLEELKRITADQMKGVVEDIPEEMHPLPDGLGAVVGVGYDSEGMWHPLVFLRGDLPVGLRADLLSFSLALTAGADRGDREPDEDGIFYVGTDAGPVCGPGVALLGSLLVQRLGRRPGDCDFRLLDPPDGARSVQDLAA